MGNSIQRGIERRELKEELKDLLKKNFNANLRQLRKDMKRMGVKPTLNNMKNLLLGHVDKISRF